jgi:phage-related protein
MTINGYKAIYDGISLDMYGLILVDIESINEESNDEECELVTSTTSYKRTYSLHSVEKSAPLKFKMTVCKEEGGYFDSDFEEDVKELFCKEKYCWLSINQTDLYNKLYYCIFTNPQKVNVVRGTAGLQFQVTCDSNNAWTNLNSKPYKTVSNTLTFNFNNQAKYANYEICPTLIITPISNGNISIKNNTTNQTITINNCVTTEVITLDSENEIAESSNGRILVNDWNLEFLAMTKGANSITLTGSFSMIMQYRIPLRIGG